MDLTQDTLAPASSAPAASIASSAAAGSDRRGDVDAKQVLVASLLREFSCDSLLVLHPENFAWLSGGGAARGVLDADAFPALFYSTDARWAVCANVDTQ